MGQRRDREARERAEEAQRQSEARFKALAETGTALIFIYQGEKFTYINSASKQMTGYSEEDLLRIKFWELVHPDHREMVHQRGLARQRNENVPTRYEFKIITKMGNSDGWILLPVRFCTKGIPAGLGIAFDVTDRKIMEEQLQASELRYRLLFKANPHPMWLYDVDTLQFLEVNDATIHYYGYSKEEFLSMSIKDIRPEEEHEALMTHLQYSVEHDGFNEAGIWRHRKKNGEIIEAEIISHTLEFNGHNAKMVLVNEMTKQKRTRKKKT